MSHQGLLTISESEGMLEQSAFMKQAFKCYNKKLFDPLAAALTTAFGIEAFCAARI
jgi:hypothetical protein